MEKNRADPGVNSILVRNTRTKIERSEREYACEKKKRVPIDLYTFSMEWCVGDGANYAHQYRDDVIR